jgi:lysophospholipase L1-like esterase
LPELIPSPSCAKVAYVLILFGANDACLPTSPTKQHVAIDKYRENLKEIIHHPSITGQGCKILLVTPPPINEYQLLVGDLEKGHPAITRLAEVTAQYAAVVREVAAEFKDRNVVLIDLWTALMKRAMMETPKDGLDQFDSKVIGSRTVPENEGLRRLLVDGLHLTGAGYSVFLDEVSSTYVDQRLIISVDVKQSLGDTGCWHGMGTRASGQSVMDLSVCQNLGIPFTLLIKH